jgi:hypothetical protein
MVLLEKEKGFNDEIRPCGFRSNGKYRQIKNSCLLSLVKSRCEEKKIKPKMAVCITMYNEDIEELQTTIKGVISNYNELRADENLKYNKKGKKSRKRLFKKEDMVVFLICDGYERINDKFKQFAAAKGFFDEDLLKDKGFMCQDKETKKWKMKEMRDVMDEGVENVPLNILHMF